MPLMDEFQEERAKLKEQPFNKKWEWFWTYYKLHVIIGAVSIFTVSSLIYNFFTQEEQLFYAALINCSSAEDASEYTTAFDEYIGVIPGEQFSILDTSMTIDETFSDYSSAQKLSLRIAANELDVYTSDEIMFYNYSIQELFIDLKTVLTPEQYEYYKEDFFYIDQALLDEDFFDLENNYYLPATIMETFDARDPQSMKDPIAIGIYFKGTEEFYDNYYIYCDETVPLVFGIPVSAPNQENAVKFLDYITQ